MKLGVFQFRARFFFCKFYWKVNMYRLLFIYTSLPHTFQAKKKLEVGNFLPDIWGGECQKSCFFCCGLFLIQLSLLPFHRIVCEHLPTYLGCKTVKTPNFLFCTKHDISRGGRRRVSGVFFWFFFGGGVICRINLKKRLAYLVKTPMFLFSFSFSFSFFLPFFSPVIGIIKKILKKFPVISYLELTWE